ncbi:MAG: ABC transporter substrate-binding protein [Ferrimonas sp.]
MKLSVRCSAFGLLGSLLITPSVLAQEIQLTLYYPVSVGGALTQVVDGMISDFKAQHQGIDVNAIYAGNYDDTRTKVLAAMNAGQQVQTSVMFSIDMLELKQRGAIRPFDDFVQTEQDQQWLDSFYPALMKNGQVDGKTYGIPFQRSTIVMFYNKDLFRAAGLDPEQPPKTWAEMAEMATKLTQHNSDGTTKNWGIMIPSTGYPYWMFGAFAKQQGEELMSADGTSINFNSPRLVEALQYWQDLSRQHKAMPQGTIEWGTLRQNFLEQNTAMMWHTTGNLAAVMQEAKFDVGVAQLPANLAPGSPTGGGNFYLMNSGTEAEQQAAYELVKFMTSPERSAQWSIATGYVGVSPDSYRTDTMMAFAKQNPQMLVARDQLAVATAELATFDAGRIRRVLDDAIQSTLTGNATPQAALDNAQQRAERFLRRATR